MLVMILVHDTAFLLHENWFTGYMVYECTQLKTSHLLGLQKSSTRIGAFFLDVCIAIDFFSFSMILARMRRNHK